MEIPFTKMQACGNDFIVMDDRSGKFLGQESVLAKQVCHRRKSLGADGLLLLRTAPQASEFGMVFVNADGLIGEMCGNGARCLAAFIRRAQLADQTLTLHTGAGRVVVEFLSATHMALHLPAAGLLRTGIAIHFQNTDWVFDALDVGPPHAVCFVPDTKALATTPVHELGRYVRHHAAFAPRGCNVNFVAREGNHLHLRTYERGVEDETLGCGTGATAAALIAHQRFALPLPITVYTHSGDSLRIDISPDQSTLRLEGDAHFVADGMLHAIDLTNTRAQSL